MDNTVQIHSDEAGGVVRTITLKKTGADTGNITIESSAAPHSPQSHDLKNIRADPTVLTLTCQVDKFFSADIRVVVKRAGGGAPPVATIDISHAIYGNGVYTYPLRDREDELMHSFLLTSAFPSPSAGDA